MFDANPEMVGGVMASCAKLVDSGIIKSTATTKFKSLTEIKEAIKVQMSGKAMKEIEPKGIAGLLQVETCRNPCSFPIANMRLSDKAMGKIVLTV